MSSVLFWWIGIVASVVALVVGIEDDLWLATFLGSASLTFCIPFYIEAIAERVFERREQEDPFWRKH